MMDLITEHIATWTAAEIPKANGERGRGRGSNGQSPHGIKKLRELILELAVRGKLVPQDPNNEPASVLLEKIAKEKNRLTKEGKIKKQNPLPKIGGDEKPFELPDGWEWARLEEYAEKITDGEHLSPEKTSDGVMLLTAKHVLEDGLSTDDPQYVAPDDAIKFRLRCDPEIGDVLICSRGTIGRCCVVNIPAYFCLMGSVIQVRIFKEVNPYYLNVYLKSDTGQLFIRGVTKGMAVNALYLKDIRLSPLPLPPLAEQHRIVGKVDELMALCDKLEQQQTDSNDTHQTLVENLLATLTTVADPAEFALSWQRIVGHFDTLFTTEESIDQLKQTILQLAVMGKLVPQDPNDEPASILLEKIAKEKSRLIKVGKIKKEKPLPKITLEDALFSPPTGWSFTRFESVVNITSGVTKGRKIAGRKVATVPYLRVANVQRGFLELDLMKEIEIPEDELEKFTVMDRDLLITEGGDWDKVGRTAIWRGELPMVAHQNHVFKARLLIEEQNELWLEKYLNSLIAREYFASSSKQTTNLASINKTQLRGCTVPIPPLAEQQRIVSKVDELMALCDTLKERLHNAQITQVQLADAIVEQAVA